MKSKAAGLLLAAGGSRRFGDDHKLLADWGGEPVVRASARALIDSGVDRVLVVTGARADDVATALAALPVRTVRNPAWAEGMGGSIALGVRALRQDARHSVLIALADMPLLAAGDHARIIAAHDHRDPRAVTRGAADGRAGHPAMFGTGWLDALTELADDRGAASILQGHEVRTVELHPDTQLDVDTPDALAVARAKRSKVR